MGRRDQDLSDHRQRPDPVLAGIIDGPFPHLPPDHVLWNVRRPEQSIVRSTRLRQGYGAASPLRARASSIEKFEGRVKVRAHFRIGNNFMSQHRSLKGASTITAKRNVL